jgi:hypothetical protein
MRVGAFSNKGPLVSDKLYLQQSVIHLLMVENASPPIVQVFMVKLLNKLELFKIVPSGTAIFNLSLVLLALLFLL